MRSKLIASSLLVLALTAAASVLIITLWGEKEADDSLELKSIIPDWRELPVDDTGLPSGWNRNNPGMSLSVGEDADFNGSKVLSIKTDRSTYAYQVDTGMVEVKRDTVYILVAKLALDEGAIGVGILDEQGNWIANRNLSRQERGLMKVYLPFDSGANSKVSAVFYNNLAEPGLSRFRIGPVGIFPVRGYDIAGAEASLAGFGDPQPLPGDSNSILPDWRRQSVSDGLPVGWSKSVPDVVLSVIENDRNFAGQKSLAVTTSLSTYSYQLSTPSISVSRRQAYVLFVELFLENGAVGVGVLDERGEWMRNKPLTADDAGMNRILLPFNSKENSSVTVVFYNNQPKEAISQFRLGAVELVPVTLDNVRQTIAHYLSGARARKRNLLLGGDFKGFAGEQFPPGWYPHYPKARLSLEKTDGTGEPPVLKVEGLSTMSKEPLLAADPIRVEPGRRYIFSCNVKTVSGEAIFRFRDFQENIDLIEKTAPVSSESFIRVELLLTIPEDIYGIKLAILASSVDERPPLFFLNSARVEAVDD